MATDTQAKTRGQFVEAMCEHYPDMREQFTSGAMSMFVEDGRNSSLPKLKDVMPFFIAAANACSGPIELIYLPPLTPSRSDPHPQHGYIGFTEQKAAG